MQTKLSIRPLTKLHKPLLVKWLSDPEVLQFYEGRDKPFNINIVESEFYTNEPFLSRRIIYFHKAPIGYVQYYPINKTTSNLTALVGKCAYGMDQFIGEADYRNKGIGTVLVKKIAKFLMEEQDAHKVILDPQVENERAVACYEKSGFKRVKKLLDHEFHEGKYRDCWLMECKKINEDGSAK